MAGASSRGERAAPAGQKSCAWDLQGPACGRVGAEARRWCKPRGLRSIGAARETVRVLASRDTGPCAVERTAGRLPTDHCRSTAAEQEDEGSRGGNPIYLMLDTAFSPARWRLELAFAPSPGDSPIEQRADKADRSPEGPAAHLPAAFWRADRQSVGAHDPLSMVAFLRTSSNLASSMSRKSWAFIWVSASGRVNCVIIFRICAFDMMHKVRATGTQRHGPQQNMRTCGACWRTWFALICSSSSLR